MRRTLLPAAAVLLALTSCATHEEEELRADLAARPDDYSPWLAGVLVVASNAADRVPAADGPEPERLG
jgi:hypothetical protein